MPAPPLRLLAVCATKMLVPATMTSFSPVPMMFSMPASVSVLPKLSVALPVMRFTVTAPLPPSWP